MKYGKEIKIALVAIVGIVLLFFGMNFLKGANLFASGNQYYITFQDVSGLSASSPIFSNGYRVGTVKDIIFDYNQKEPVKVAVELDEKLQVPEGSSAAIVSDMLGNVQVNLLLADGKTMLSPGQVIDGQVAGGAMSKVAELVPAIERMLPKLDSILGSLNTVLADPSIPSSLHNIQTMTGDLTTSTKELNKLLASVNGQLPGMMTKADGVLDNATTVDGQPFQGGCRADDGQGGTDAGRLAAVYPAAQQQQRYVGTHDERPCPVQQPQFDGERRRRADERPQGQSETLCAFLGF